MKKKTRLWSLCVEKQHCMICIKVHFSCFRLDITDFMLERVSEGGSAAIINPETALLQQEQFLRRGQEYPGYVIPQTYMCSIMHNFFCCYFVT